MVEPSKSDGKLCRIFGLTGSIAAGKSTVARLLRKSGRFEIVDADQIVHHLYEPSSPVASELLSTFGTLDRKTISKSVFADLALKRKLEKIIHPAVQKESERLFLELSEKHKKDPRFLGIIYEAALLIEAGRADDFKERILLVTAPEWVRKKRLIERDQKTPEEAELILKSQLSEEHKRKFARWEIVNDHNPAHLQRQVEDWIEQL